MSREELLWCHVMTVPAFFVIAICFLPLLSSSVGLVVSAASYTSPGTSLGYCGSGKVSFRLDGLVLELRGGSGFYSTDPHDPRIHKALRKNQRASKGKPRAQEDPRALQRAEERARALQARQEQKEEETRQARKRHRQLAARRQLGVKDGKELQQILWSACENGNVEILPRCAMAGVDVNYNYSVVSMQTIDGFVPVEGINATALHVAARNNHTGVIDRLQRMGADVNARTAFGTTPLMTACHRGCTAAAVLLVEGGADLWLEDVHGHLAAEIAETYAEDWRLALWVREAMSWKAAGAGGPMPLPYRPGEYPVPEGSASWLEAQPRAWAARSQQHTAPAPHSEAPASQEEALLMLQEGGPGAEEEGAEEEGGVQPLSRAG